MSQNDYTIANQSAPSFRADLNSALQALASQSSGATAPSTTYANMVWYDSSNDILKMRNEADDAWIDLFDLNQSTGTSYPSAVPLVIDEDDFASNSATRPPSQQSTKAYVDDAAKVKAWVNFNGTGTVAIRDSFNVSSITDNGTGDYTINFTSAFANANYAALVSSSGSTNAVFQRISAYNTSSVSVVITGWNGGSGSNFFSFDPDTVTVGVLSN